MYQTLQFEERQRGIYSLMYLAGGIFSASAMTVKVLSGIIYDSAFSAYADDLRQFAESSLKGKQRHVFDKVLDSDGIADIDEIAKQPDIAWNVPWDNAWNSVKREINKKLEIAKLPFELVRHDNEARLSKTGQE